LEAAYPMADWLSTLKGQVPVARTAIAARLTEGPTIYRGTLNPALLSPEELAYLEYNKSRVWSVTQLELYAKCAFRFFAHDVLALREQATMEEGVGAMERGSALHEVLRQFLVSRRERNLAPLQDLPEAELSGAYRDAKDIADRYFQSNSKLHPFWRLDSETILSDKRPGGSVLWKFIEREHQRKYELRPRFFEVSFGGSGKAAKSPIDSEVSTEEPAEIGGFKLRGKIDRIDSADDGTFAVIDYKSGKSSPGWNDIKRGQSLQLPLYLRVAEDLLRTHVPPLKGIAALYHKILGTESERKLGLALSDYAGTAFEKIGQKGKGLITSKDELSELIEETVTYAKSYVDGVASGNFPLVQKSFVKACEHCPYGAVCRIEEAKEADVLQ
ncbi:MAG TPA: PD-(D/E)XK nuclease family protein, partial [Candidatus Kapabacteria bacterium]